MTHYEYPRRYSAQLISKMEESNEGTYRGQPSETIVGEMLDVAFVTSMFEEEGRPINASIGHIRPQYVSESHRLTFSSPISFTPDKLARLAHAVDPTRGFIAVYQDEVAELKIWGIVHFDRRDPEIKKSTAYPIHMRVRTLRHGTIVASIGSWPIFLYSRGTVNLFDLGMKTTTFAVARLLGDYMPEWSSEDSIYFRSAITNVAGRMLQHGHGGMILIVPSNTTELSGVSFPRYGVERRHPFLRRTRGAPFCSTNYDDDINLLARLTAIDGALVLSADLRVHGFGARVDVQTEEESDTVLGWMIDPWEPEPAIRNPLRLSDFTGTRHPAAVRFCKAQKSSIAIVASQDGDMSIFAKDPASDSVVAIRPFKYGIGFMD